MKNQKPQTFVGMTAVCSSATQINLTEDKCVQYSKIWLNLIFAAVNLTFIRGQKAFPVFRADQEIIRLPCGQGQLSRIWKV